MASTWVRQGPVASPPAALAYLAGAVILIAALVGAALGFTAAWRPGGDAELGGRAGAAASGVIDAKPIVDLANTAAPPASAGAADASSSDDDAKAASLAARAAAAQADQAKPAGAKGDIDQINTPPDEKPPAPVKPSTDEAAPNAPVKSDVPF
ncbi:MAG TPA: hypothetical protein VG248_10925 [Caulobacteraceae bacterium]|jgi:hypothetical protein|nr:hypothetical protein [Caulobacteraceae bacterium]